jgi:serine phosphatase RsbU (regulator of sigma subunit)/CHASE2 domain-containing sensor protein
MTGSKSVSDPRLRTRRIAAAGLIGALAAALLLILAGDRLSRPLFDAWQRLSPRDLSGTQVHVVLIDPESLGSLGAWPWPRYHLARLTEAIAARGAKVIGFDMLFPEPDRVRPDIFAGLYPELSGGTAAEVRGLKPMDELFGEVIGKSPVVLARAGVMESGADPTGLPVEAAFGGALPASLVSYPQAIANIPELEDVPLGHGLINGTPDPDGVVRRLPLVAKVGGQPMPGFALELARVALGAEEIAASGDAVAIGGRRIPIDADGRMRLRFGSFPPASVSSAVDVLRLNFPADAFAGKIVLVGLGAEGTADIVATPLAAEGFGVFVHAQAADAMLRGGGWLSRPRWAEAVEWAAGALLVLLALLLLPRKGRPKLALPAAAAMLAAGAWLAFDLGSLLLDPLRPLILGGGASLGVAAGMFAEARRERERLREALVEERVGAAATESELEAARAIQRGMLPPRKALAALDPRLDIDALLEPARSVGGDFYDAVRLGPDRIAVSIADVTGKGVPASLFMALSKALSKSVVLREGRLEEAAALLNEELSRDNVEAMAVTMLIAVVDLASGEVAMVNAGHEDPIRILADGTAEDVKMEGGPPFCVVDYPWPVETLKLAPGEALVLVTDGVTEAQTADGALYGRARTRAAAAGGGRAAEITEALLRSVRAFEAGAEPSDDLTVLAFRYLPSSGADREAV